MVEMAISIPSANLSLISLSPSIPRRITTTTSSSSSSSLCLSSSNSSFFSRTITQKRGQVFVGRRTSRRGLSCNCLFGLGVPELVVIAGVAALVFGPKKLPEVGRSIGKTVKSFQQAAKEFETELKKDPDSAKEEPPLEKPTAAIEEENEVKVSSTKES